MLFFQRAKSSGSVQNSCRSEKIWASRNDVEKAGKRGKRAENMCNSEDLALLRAWCCCCCCWHQNVYASMHFCGCIFESTHVSHNTVRKRANMVWQRRCGTSWLDSRGTCEMSSHVCEATSHTQRSSPTETLNGSLTAHTYRAPRSNADSKLLPYEGVVDPLGNVMEGFSVIRADERGKEAFTACLSSAQGGMDGCRCL